MIDVLPEKAHVLLVEDDEIDVLAVKRAFKQASIDNPMIVAKDGSHALDLLKSKQIPKPYIILMDLNLPRMSGLECMAEIRQDEHLRRSVIFVLTTSKSEEDKMKAYNLNTAGYILKTDVANGFKKAVDMLDSYWNTVQLPLH